MALQVFEAKQKQVLLPWLQVVAIEHNWSSQWASVAHLSSTGVREHRGEGGLWTLTFTFLLCDLLFS